MKNLNLLEACSIVGDTLALRMALASNRETMSSLMPHLKDCPISVKGKALMVQDNKGYILYPVGYPEHKIRRIHSRKSHSGPNHAFMYKGETSRSRQSTVLNCLRRKLLVHQMNLASHLRLFMHLMF
jgi:hypothetical protein